jgi:hypothetical protein
MEYLQFGSIKRVALPADWIVLPEQSTAVMDLIACHPSIDEDVEMAFFRRREEVMIQAMDAFRATLAQPIHRIPDASEELVQLSQAMGNAGYNQWTNKAQGSGGPAIRLLKAETLQLKEKKVLQARGSFIEATTRKAVNEYCGIFVDALPDKRIIEEVYLQVPSRYGYYRFERYLKVFTATIASIEWT